MGEWYHLLVYKSMLLCICLLRAEFIAGMKNRHVLAFLAFADTGTEQCWQSHVLLVSDAAEVSMQVGSPQGLNIYEKGKALQLFLKNL